MNFKFFLLVFLIVFTSLFSQKIYSVRATLNTELNVFDVSDSIHRLLFISTKGDLILPDHGYYMNINNKYSGELARETIAYIPMNGEEYTDLEKGINGKIVQLSVDEDSLFYSQNKNIDRAILKRVFRNPSLKDTLYMSDIDHHFNMENTKEWIQMLSKNRKVIIADKACAETQGGGLSFMTYRREKIRVLAKKKLHTVTTLFPETNINWRKKQWEFWFENLIK